VDRVLLDGTTLISVARLLNGQDKPSALNVFALSLMVESLILHDKIIVIDTLQNDNRLSNAARRYGGIVSVERCHAFGMVQDYISMEFPQLNLSELSERKSDLAGDSKRARRHLEEVLGGVSAPFLWYSKRDSDMGDYLSLLDQTHKAQRAAMEAAKMEAANAPLDLSGAAGWLGGLALIALGVAEQVITGRGLGHGYGGNEEEPLPDGTPIAAAVTADKHMLEVPEAWAEVYTEVGNKSPWAEGYWDRVTSRTKFTPGLITRAHFYILASEVLGAPYRPDVLRAPICWKFFQRGSFADFALEERFVDAAERLARERVASVNDFLGRAAFATLPLFVARVLNDSRSRSDIIPRTLEIRNSAEAQRFREHISTLYHAEDAGNFDAVLKEITRYSGLLRRRFGDRSASGDVIWSFAATAGKAAVQPTPAAAIDLGASGVAAAGALRQWWYGRKMALIAKTLKEARKARALQPELQRLFGANLHEDDLLFLDRVAQIGTPGHAPEANAT
jgi:hypothetical protein